MKNLLRMTVAAALVLLMAGCCHCRSYQRKTRRPLVGTEWQLIQLGGETIRPVEGSFHMTLSAEGQLSGVGSANRITGPYQSDERRSLKIGPLASTRMASPDPKHEAAFIEALESATHYDMDGPMLLILSNGELRAVFQAVPTQTDPKAKPAN